MLNFRKYKMFSKFWTKILFDNRFYTTIVSGKKLTSGMDYSSPACPLQLNIKRLLDNIITIFLLIESVLYLIAN